MPDRIHPFDLATPEHQKAALAGSAVIGAHFGANMTGLLAREIDPRMVELMKSASPQEQQVAVEAAQAMQAAVLRALYGNY